MTVRDRILEAIEAREVQSRGIDHTGSARNNHRTVRCLSYGNDRQRITVRIGVIGKDINRYSRVFVTRGEITLCHRCIIDGTDHDSDRCSIFATGTVANRVAEHVAAGETRCRDIRDAAIGVDHRTTMGRHSGSHDRQCIAVNITIICQDLKRDRGIFTRCRAVINGVWRVIDGDHGNGDGCAGSPSVSIAYQVCDAVGTVEICAWRIGDGRTAINKRGVAVRGLRDGKDGERITVGIAVIRQDIGRDRRILVSACNIVACDRRVVNRDDIDDNSCASTGALSVADGVTQGVSAGEIRTGRVHDAVTADNRRTVRRCNTHGGQDKDVAIHVGVVT